MTAIREDKILLALANMEARINASMDAKLEAMEARINARMDAKFDLIMTAMSDMEKRLNARMDGLENRIDNLESPGEEWSKIHA